MTDVKGIVNKILEGEDIRKAIDVEDYEQFNDEQKAIFNRFDHRMVVLSDIQEEISSTIKALSKLAINPEKFNSTQEIEDKELTLYKNLSDKTGVDFLVLLRQK